MISTRSRRASVHMQNNLFTIVKFQTNNSTRFLSWLNSIRGNKYKLDWSILRYVYRYIIKLRQHCTEMFCSLLCRFDGRRFWMRGIRNHVCTVWIFSNVWNNYINITNRYNVNVRRQTTWYENGGIRPFNETISLQRLPLFKKWATPLTDRRGVT